MIFVWDVDKTYLRTDFGSWKGLVRAALERAEQKASFPGAAALLREVGLLPEARVVFVSGSPRQMRRVIEEKLRLDGVRCDGIALKPNLSNVLRGRLRAVREQVGYKLPLLLERRAKLGFGPPEVLFGDDAESDAFIYSLYADVLAGRVDARLVAAIVERARAYKDDRARLAALLPKVPRGDAVRRIFIHLETRTPPSRFDRYGRRVAPVFNYFQAAVVLLEDGVIDAAAVVRVAADMVTRGGYKVGALANSLQDLYRRGLCRAETAEALGEQTLRAEDELRALGSAAQIVAAFRLRLRELGREHVAPPPLPLAPEIDYLRLLDED
ncbi:MAG: phosphatase domain-containing protein, partial [Myxococcota bacterium]